MKIINNRILIQKNDNKSQAWAQAAKNNKLGELIPIAGSPMRMPFVLINYIFSIKKPKAIIFRYLNDYHSFFKTLLRTFTDLLTILIAKISGIKIIWICHNVDKETISFYPKFISLRRNQLIKYSKKVFVMDDLLISHAEKMLQLPKKKIDSLCFGRTDIFNGEIKQNEHFLNIIKNWEYYRKKQKGEAFVGLWIGTFANKKMQGLEFLLKAIIEQKNTINQQFALIVIGPIRKDLEKYNPKICNSLINNKNILFVNRYVDLPANFWNNIADFIWKPNDDLSVTLTAYNSAMAKLPLVAFKNTFLGKFIEHYKLGFTIIPETFSLKELSNFLKNWDPNHTDSFLKEKNWDCAVKKIFDVVVNN